MSAEFSRALTAARLGRNLGAVCRLKPAALDWQSARVTQRSSWQSCKATKADSVRWSICGAKRAGFFGLKTEAKNGHARVPWTRARFILARYASTRQTISAFIFSASRYWYPMTAERISGKI